MSTRNGEGGGKGSDQGNFDQSKTGPGPPSRGKAVSMKNSTQTQNGKPPKHPIGQTHAEAKKGLQSALDRIHQAASLDKELRFTSLWHHVYNPDRLRKAYQSLKRRAAPGVDGVTWQHYGERLEANLQDLSARLARGAPGARVCHYRA